MTTPGRTTVRRVLRRVGAGGSVHRMTQSPGTARAHMLSRIRDEQAAWRVLVDEVGRDRMLEPGPMGDWSFRDLVVHLLGWRERTIARLEAAAAGREVPPDPWPDGLGSDDGVNDWIQEQGRDRSVADVLADADRSFDRLAAALDAFPDERLTDPGGVPGFEGYPLATTDWLSHWHEEHEDDVRRWLAERA